MRRENRGKTLRSVRSSDLPLTGTIGTSVPNIQIVFPPSGHQYVLRDGLLDNRTQRALWSRLGGRLLTVSLCRKIDALLIANEVASLRPIQPINHPTGFGYPRASVQTLTADGWQVEYR